MRAVTQLAAEASMEDVYINQEVQVMWNIFLEMFVAMVQQSHFVDSSYDIPEEMKRKGKGQRGELSRRR